jgi:hypothetical protein
VEFVPTPEDFLQDLRKALPGFSLRKVRGIRAKCTRMLSHLRKTTPGSEEVSYSGPMDPDDPLDQIRVLGTAIQLCETQIALRGRIDDKVRPKTSENSAGSGTGEALFTHSEDYSSVSLNGQRFALTSAQSQVIGKLHEAWKQGIPEFRQAYLLEELETSSKRLRDSFKSNPAAWKALIRRGERKGTVRLNLPELKKP